MIIVAIDCSSLGETSSEMIHEGVVLGLLHVALSHLTFSRGWRDLIFV